MSTGAELGHAFCANTHKNSEDSIGVEPSNPLGTPLTIVVGLLVLVTPLLN